MSTPPDQQSPSIEKQKTDAPDSIGPKFLVGLRVVVWLVAMTGLIGYLAIGSVSVVSYRYSSFLQQTFREVDRESIFDIWAEQIRDLPSSQGLLNAGFKAAIAVSVAGVAYGAWLLLVSSGREATGDAALRTRYRRAR